MQIFMTGGSGYIGQATIKALIKHGHAVAALVRSEASAQRAEAAGATAVLGGLDDLESLRKHAAAADGVIHLAQPDSGDVPAADLAAAQAMQDGAGDRPYVHTGGVWVYGNTDGVVGEDAPLAPPPIVSWRLANEKQVMARAGSGGHPVLVMPGVVYGYGRGLIEAFYTEPARSSGSVAYIGDGRSHWSLVHVDDVAELYVAALGAPAGARYAGVDDAPVSALDIALAASRAAGCPDQIRSITLDEARATMGPIADAFALDQRLTSARATAELGWRPARRAALAELAA